MIIKFINYHDSNIIIIIFILYKTNNKIGPGANEDTNYGPYYQSKRLDLYNKYADKLIEVLAAFFKFFT